MYNINSISNAVDSNILFSSSFSEVKFFAHKTPTFCGFKLQVKEFMNPNLVFCTAA